MISGQIMHKASATIFARRREVASTHFLRDRWHDALAFGHRPVILWRHRFRCHLDRLPGLAALVADRALRNRIRYPGVEAALGRQAVRSAGWASLRDLAHVANDKIGDGRFRVAPKRALGVRQPVGEVPGRLQEVFEKAAALRMRRAAQRGVADVVCPRQRVSAALRAQFTAPRLLPPRRS